MRHQISGKKLNRDTNHRRSLIKNLVGQLVQNEHLTTTQAKAKVIQKHTEKLINKAKPGTLHARRLVLASLFDKNIAHKIVDVLAPQFKDKPGGYLKQIRTGRRQGDNTMLVRLEFIKPPAPAKPTTKTT